jgi:CubicO group peptidase (beta-lactamase class C family)
VFPELFEDYVIHPIGDYPDRLAACLRSLTSVISVQDYLKFARMLHDGKAPDGKPILARKTLEMMRANRITPEQLPLTIGMNVLPGYGWGLGVRVMLDRGKAMSITSDGELGWSGAASTYFWVDPTEDMTGVIMVQYLASMLPLTDDMRTAAYQMLE